MEENINVESNTVVADSTVSTNNQEGTSVEPSSTQETKVETKQDDFLAGEKMAKAFSSRLNKEKEKLAKQLSEELETKYKNQYANFDTYKKVVEMASKEFDMSEVDYLKSLGLTPSEIKEATNTPKSEKDLLLEQLLEEKKAKEVENNWNTQIEELKKINPDLKADDISDEMLSIHQEKNIPLAYIYAFNQLTSGKQGMVEKLKTEILKDIQKANISSGTLTSQTVTPTTKSVKDMSSKEFAELKEKIKKGEIKSL